MSSDLETALDAVHAALLEGDLAALGTATSQIDALVGQTETLPGADLVKIRAKAARNAPLLQAAMQGVRAADRRLGELREAARGHKTYGPTGLRAAMAGPAGTLQQRV